VARGWIFAAFFTLACAAPAALDAPAELPSDPEPVLRVGTSGDYAPFSWSWPPDGFDPAVARAYAADRGLGIQWVRFRWPDLVADLQSGRFDVAMSGVTVRPERLVAGRFSVPVATSGAVVLVGESVAAPDIGSLDRADVRIGVNAGGHLERVARARFAVAQLRAVADNAAVRELLREGAVDAVVTDTLEAPLWRADDPGLRVLGPFTRDRKAYLIAAENQSLARDLDGWLLDREADGTLASLRSEYLGSGATTATAELLPALVASIERRLSLMPLVADFKGREGLPVQVPERERRVLDAAVEAARRAAVRAGFAPLDEGAVREFYAAQIRAARSIQRRVLAEARTKAPRHPGFDLDRDLRPALLRIGEQMASLLVGLPASPAVAEVVGRSSALLLAGGLEADDAERIAAALGRICAAHQASDRAQ
jgi:cyclohexadienyl dehydratase